MTGIGKGKGLIMSDRLKNTELRNIQIHDSFWDKYIGLVDDVILPFQWNLINDKVEGAEKSYCIRNFKIACGQLKGEHKGMVFQDTDVAKWLEAVAFSLAKQPNAGLEALADEAIELIAGAQCEDGYLNTYYTITGQPRFRDLFEGHELYTAGHMMEAAAAYYNATGKDKLLKVMCRFADYLYEVFGREEGKIHGYPGHPEIELALIKLYRVTGESRYLSLADYFIRERGKQPCYFEQEDCIRNGHYLFPEFKDFKMDYCQAHKPLSEQMTAEGHAVRAVYLYSAMADLAFECEDAKLLEQCCKLWDNIVTKRMYVTGSIGSAAYGERFTTDYDLPNNTNYSESCATVGLAMFSNRMLQITREGKYADAVEQALYNTLLAGIAMDGRHFFYVNPLESVPDIAERNPAMSHVKTTRQLWFGVACCPPNITRTLASMGDYMYSIDQNAIFVNLFLNSSMEAELESGRVRLELDANYPVSGEVKLTVHPQKPGERFTIAVRKPGYSETYSLEINGKRASGKLEKGYLYLEQAWNEADVITVTYDVSFRYVRANPRVRNNIGKVCLMKGPWVYCLEEADNGSYLSSVSINTKEPAREVFDKELLGGILCASLKGKRIDYAEAGEELYSTGKPAYVEAAFRAIPYCCWNNRGRGEMLVWVREQE